MDILDSIWQLPAYASYLARIEGEWRSFTGAVIKSHDAPAWASSKSPRDLITLSLNEGAIPVIRAAFGSDADPEEYEPTAEEKVAMIAAYESSDRPNASFVVGEADIPARILSEGYAKADCYRFMEHRRIEGQTKLITVMIEARKTVVVDGEELKKVRRFTYFDDGVWRNADPEGFLPIYNAHRLGAGCHVVIHEGPKAAAVAQAMADYSLGIRRASRTEQAEFDANPWCHEFAGYTHIAFAGGAFSWHRADWSVLKKAGAVAAYCMGDNDTVGVSAMNGVSRRIEGMPVYQFSWDGKFPPSWDAGDPFPEAAIEATHSLNFRNFFELVTPPTHLVPVENDSGKVTNKRFCNPAWAQSFIYTSRYSQFFVRNNPRRTYDANALVNHYQFGEHTLKGNDLALGVKAIANRERLYDVIWRPMDYVDASKSDYESRRVRDLSSGHMMFNSYMCTPIRSVPGDIGPFMDFATHLIPDPLERAEFLRWTATLVGKASRHLDYAVILASSLGATGKSTYVDKVLLPLVGTENVISTQPKAMFENHNAWRFEKRLVIINEFECGSQPRNEMEDRFKAFITDRQTRGRKMYRDEEQIEVNVAFAVTDNRRVPFPISASDRRWFMPQVTESVFSYDRFRALETWLNRGGYGFILHWACHSYADDPALEVAFQAAAKELEAVEASGSEEEIEAKRLKLSQMPRAFVQEGEQAPMTRRKRQWIEESKSEAQVTLSRLAGMVASKAEPAAITAKGAKAWLDSILPKANLKEATIKEALASSGLILLNAHKDNPRVDLSPSDRGHYILMNASLAALAPKPGALKSHVVNPADLMTI